VHNDILLPEAFTLTIKALIRTFIYIPRSYMVKLNVLALKLKSREKMSKLPVNVIINFTQMYYQHKPYSECNSIYERMCATCVFITRFSQTFIN